MNLEATSAVVTGGVSGLGLATATRLADSGAHVVLADLPSAPGAEVAATFGGRATFVPADVTDPEALAAAVDVAVGKGPLRVAVNCAGRGSRTRLVGKDGAPGDLETFNDVVKVNLSGSFNLARLAAAAMAKNEQADGERGVIVLTASVAAFEGQIGQSAYAASKAGIVGLTLCAARDLASKAIRVCTIAPGLFDTPLLGRLDDEIRAGLARSIPHPSRLGDPAEFARLVQSIVDNPMLNGETIRLDGAIRMAPR
ncbi:SDR family NAD(P)-dependent oxidoreductase [Amycolatopsis acidicola]|uniref:SDR family NAD(P)-dependent oxidoreductase n=1 Tax=Amycolatopsis acidicola TaxID=2596893 RepID=A0A5N0UPD8_9PSEU|nr:SDR family NAD(P)-dependent oxidoreductase [Amycolatopsis acidicola]KAA9150215.1 SDR family NAD(P)-dependent oxidoreductase [Amycolatopsis acidicola]